MRREEVERLLPPYSDLVTKNEPRPHGYIMTTISGGAQGVAYQVAPGIQVLVFYDYTGVPRDANGQAMRHDSPDNRVVELPKVTAEASLPGKK